MNYKHLFYVWTVLRTGSIARASEQLHLTPQTLSGQIKQLEDRLGKPLFRKSGRGLEATDAGRVVQRYADEIFTLGNALKEALSSGHDERWQPAFRVGVADSVPKSVACHVLEPALPVLTHAKLLCHEGKLPALLAELAIHRLDLVISDVPLPTSLSIKAYTHLLGSSGMTFFAAPALLKRAGFSLRRARARFPACLAQLPFLMPGTDTAVRPRLEGWLQQNALSVAVVAEFDDGALTKAFGRRGVGVFMGPTVLAAEIAAQYDVQILGAAADLVEEFYAISIERRITHAAVAAITSAARRELFA
ncbi:transcriptional activator NhaR [Polaromonas sp.]|uniref:transcriptional activator NhaR n=1 Tax=Polaromonas sp. TaxID=1869339 RepID=UPI0037506396